jgi:hypothetical protein
MAPSLCKVLNLELLQEDVLVIYARNSENRKYWMKLLDLGMKMIFLIMLMATVETP